MIKLSFFHSKTLWIFCESTVEKSPAKNLQLDPKNLNFEEETLNEMFF